MNDTRNIAVDHVDARHELPVVVCAGNVSFEHATAGLLGVRMS